jgi:DeoR family transcriptional regulator, suf operon transcriptional repressor
MLNARQKILNYITEQQHGTAEELSRVFKVTPANIRHHLSILTDQGSIKVIGLKAAPGKGRPTQIYASTREVTQNNIDLLADILLTNLVLNAEQECDEPILDGIALKMVSGYPLDRSNPTRRLYSAIRVLNQMNFHAHWEAHVENPRIMLNHCPYRSLAESHPELCQLDKCILEELVGVPVTQIDKHIINDKGISQCVFVADSRK